MESTGKEIVFIRTTMYVYLAFVLYFTLMPIAHLYHLFLITRISNEYGAIYWCIRRERRFFQANRIKCPNDDSVWYLITYEYQEKFFICCDICFLMSLSIELLQPLINGARSSDVTDIITNVKGRYWLCNILAHKTKA